MIKAGLSAEPPLRRPFSILSVDPGAETVTLFVKAIGQGSRALCALAPGDVAQCLGPLGRPFTPPPPGVLALLVAGGYGVAPFRFLGERLRGTGRAARLFYGGRSAADLPLLERLRDLGMTLVPATEDGSLGARGRVTAPLEAHLERVDGPVRLYACGPDAMLHAVARIADRRGLCAEVSLDPWMGCGVGTCLGCVVRVQEGDEPRPRYRCACTEGPVFDAARVVWPGDESSRARRAAALPGEQAGGRG
jgi:dihydroorotate dehydrogenase electron transfer subunit